jgi:hypothetical protein
MNQTAARNYFTALEETGRSANTIRQAKVVLGALLGHAPSVRPSRPSRDP